MGVLPIRYVCVTDVRMLEEVREDTGFPRPVPDCCDLLRVEPRSSEARALAAEPCLQPLTCFVKIIHASLHVQCECFTVSRVACW